MRQLVGTDEEYDLSTNSWVFKAEMPIPRADFAIAVFQNKIYCIGGRTDSAVVSLNEVYDPARNSWETKAAMPTTEEGIQASVVNGKIYIIGNGPKYAYNPTSDNWTTITPMPTIQNGSLCSCVFDNKVFVLGSPFIRIYDPENDSWITGAQIPVSMTRPVAVATSGIDTPARIYVLDENIVATFDPQTNGWRAGAVLPAVLPNPSPDVGRVISDHEGYGVTVCDDAIYVVGGETVTVSKEYANSRFYPEDISELAVNQQYVPFGFGTVSPEISVTSPKNANYSSREVLLNFTVNKPFNWTCYSLDGKENTTINGNTALTELSSALHTITLYANDSFGNVGSQTVMFTVDQPEVNTFPTVTVAAVAGALAVVVAGVFVYFKKRTL